MSSRKRKATDKKVIAPSSSTDKCERCSAIRSNGARCSGDGKYDGLKGKICRDCYENPRRRATVGDIASSSKSQERSSQRSSPSVNPQYSSAQEHSHRETKTGTGPHHLEASSNKGKRPASNSPSSGRLTPHYQPNSPDLRGFGTSENSDSLQGLQIPAYGQGSYPVEWESYIPPQPPQPPQTTYRPVSPYVTGIYSPGFQTSGYGQQADPAESELYQPPQSPYHPRSPDLSGFTTSEAETAPNAYVTSVVEQSSTQSLDTQQAQYQDRGYDEGDLYSANTPPRKIRQTPSLTSAPRRRPLVEDSRDLAPPRRTRQWEKEYSSEKQGGSRSHHSTTTAGGEGSSEFNRMPNVSGIQSQMRSTSIEDPNILAASDVRGSYDQVPSTRHAPSGTGAGPSSFHLPEVAQGVVRDVQWEHEKQQWAMNTHEMRRRYLDQYPASNPVSEGPEELRAHLLFAMSLGEGRICTYRSHSSHRCKKRTVAGKKYFYCGGETHNDQNNHLWYRGMYTQGRKIGSCYQIVESSQGSTDTSRRQCGRKINSTYCDLEGHDEKYLNIPQPRYNSYRK